MGKDLEVRPALRLGYGGWWSATEDESDYAWHRGMGLGYDYVGDASSAKGYGLSARCVR